MGNYITVNWQGIAFISKGTTAKCPGCRCPVTILIWHWHDSELKHSKWTCFLSVSGVKHTPPPQPAGGCAEEGWGLWDWLPEARSWTGVLQLCCSTQLETPYAAPLSCLPWPHLHPHRWERGVFVCVLSLQTTQQSAHKVRSKVSPVPNIVSNFF